MSSVALTMPLFTMLSSWASPCRSQQASAMLLGISEETRFPRSTWSRSVSSPVTVMIMHVDLPALMASMHAWASGYCVMVASG